MRSYTKDHEWVQIDGDIITVGISDHAQSQLGDVVFVELPAIGKVFDAGSEAAVVESVKAASDVYSPVGGEVVAVNSELEGDPGLVNRDPAGEGWFFRVKLAGDLPELMDAAAYAAFAADH